MRLIRGILGQARPAEAEATLQGSMAGAAARRFVEAGRASPGPAIFDAAFDLGMDLPLLALCLAVERCPPGSIMGAALAEH